MITPKPEIKRLVFDGRLLTALVRERKLDLVLSPDVARDDWPGDMRVTRVDWDGGRVVATLEAAAWPVAGDWVELLYRVPVAPPAAVKPEPIDEHMGEIFEANV